MPGGLVLAVALTLYLTSALAELARFIMNAVMSLPIPGREVMSMVTITCSIAVTLATLRAQPWRHDSPI